MAKVRRDVHAERTHAVGGPGSRPYFHGTKADLTDLVESSGLPRIRLHDLRHTHASLALAAGIDVKVVSARSGHSSTAITSDLYTHVIPAVARQAADTIASSVPRSRAQGRRRVSEAVAREALRSSPSGDRQRHNRRSTGSRRGDSNP